MALISKRTIAEVNDRLDPITVVGDYVRLEQKSGRWWGKCPFHGAGQEKTASFKVEPDLKMYHCFGCQKGGSIINFVMEMEKISYPEAIKLIARKIGIEIIYEEGSSSSDGGTSEQENTFKEQLFELYKRTTKTFQYFLTEKPEGKEALDYILKRGISTQMIEAFKIGYSPPDRNFLHNFLKSKGYSDDFLEKSGLFSANYKKIPLFSGRLMFPITDRQGRIVAFGGRALPGLLQSDGKEPPKYINSPETEIYKKRQTVFAIEQAKEQMRQTKSAYLVEGYTDVIALHQAGITNAVAPLGTAFTDEQAKWLNKWVNNLYLLFDTDEAGQKAAYTAIMTCRKNGISCSLVDTQEGIKTVIGEDHLKKIKDPAEILQKFGHEILKKILKFIINDFEYLILRGKLQNTAADGEINRAVSFMFPYLDSLASEIDRSDSITRIADIFKIERAAVQKDYSQWKSDQTRFSHVKDEKDQGGQQKQGLEIHPLRRNAELSLLTAVAVNMELYTEFRAALEIKEIEDKAAKEIFIALEECFIHDENGIDSLLSRIKDENLRNYVSEMGTSGEYQNNVASRLMEDGIKKIRKKRLDKRLKDISSQMREIERKNEGANSSLIDELLEEKKFIDEQIRKL
ncbi:MAG: DNA primase [Treponema sp.]|nr:DNA primase [Treponema sp.]MCL2251504.1 DNA primase [Treponema sp.]